jgi:DNA modification methylase
MAKEIKYRKLVDLKKLPNNPRTIKKDDMERLKKSIKDNPDYFEARPIILSNRTGELVILAGNQRYEAAKALGMDEVPTFLLEGLTEAREREIIIRDNVSNGDWDMDALANEWDTQELTDWGVDITWDEPEQEVIEDNAPEVNESEPADSELGKVYQLGRHRLMCGDSTDAGSVAILMDGQKADMVFTDPPYGMFLDTKMSARKTTKGDWTPTPKNYRKVIGDNEDFSTALINTIFDNFNYCKEIFIWGADYFAELIPQRTEGAWFVWDKRAGIENVEFTLSEFELLWSRQKHQRRIARVRWMGLLGTEQEPDHRRFHPTQKPIELSRWFIEKFSKKDQAIVDIYGGSGSTLIACEQLGRKCYMMELDPEYCDVIRKRYWKFVTGSEEGWQDGTKAK